MKKRWGSALRIVARLPSSSYPIRVRGCLPRDGSRQAAPGSGREQDRLRCSRSGDAEAAFGQGTYDYEIPFTTAVATATSRDGTETLTRSGRSITDDAHYAQIVGATTNRANAFPKPGAAVYTVLSGRFDTLPRAK